MGLSKEKRKMMTKKKTTKHVVGHIINSIKKWQLGAYNGVTYPLVNGVVFSNEGSKDREPLFDASNSGTKDIFAYWLDEDKGIIEISAPKPGYEIKAPKSMELFFSGTVFFFGGTCNHYIQFLDVSHLDVSNTTNFSACFKCFGNGMLGGKIVGLKKWDVSQGIHFSRMFAESFSANNIVDLDLSGWRFSENRFVDVWGMFNSFAISAKRVNLNLDDWQTLQFYNLSHMFENFAAEAKVVNIIGIDNWTVNYVNNFCSMFRNFAPKSKCCLDLSSWNKEYKQLSAYHDWFANGTFFRIKEPKWAD